MSAVDWIAVLADLRARRDGLSQSIDTIERLFVRVHPTPATVETRDQSKPGHWNWHEAATYQRIASVVLAAREPITKADIAEQIDTTTAGMYLPLMVKAGELEVIPGRVPYRYVATDKLRAMVKR